MKYLLDLRGMKPANFYELDENFCGTDEKGNRISFTNFYMERNHTPFFAVSGEFHYSRTCGARWEQELLKMKACGINTIATYAFWIHHEEEEGVFDFSGRRNLRKFLLLCQKHALNVILRIGPFAHGECRNGGFPDWLFAEPFEARKLSEGFLFYVRRYFSEIGRQTEGLYFKDGGPVIAVQIDNEYMHSSSMWNFSLGVNQEFIFIGDEREVYMNKIRNAALSCGIRPVFFTATAWGGAIVPASMLPMWGGYCFRPWMLMPNGKHPKTDEFLYQDFHNNEVKTDYDFHPPYAPESRPYCCCEIGSGMMVSYAYRFRYPYKSVDAIANIKTASGCNFLGYYMYHGGSNPLGRHGDYMNEGSLPKISYDYQAAIGEYGQVRESAKRSKILHYFVHAFGKELCPLKTVLPKGASQISPGNETTLRYAVRTDGRRGFLFLNNFQDHAVMPDKTGETVLLKTQDDELLFPVSLAGDENAILPFHFDLNGIDLTQATASPVTVLDGAVKTWVFFVPDGMSGEFVLETAARFRETGVNRFFFPEGCRAQLVTAVKDGREARILTINRTMANNLYLVKDGLVFSDAVVLEDENGIRLETENSENVIYTYPKTLLCSAPGCLKIKETGIPEEMNVFRVSCKKQNPTPVLRNTAPHRYVLKIPKDGLDGLRDLMLRIDYVGDIGNAFLKHRLISDNYSNGAAWEIGLSDFREELKEHDLVLYITPVKKGTRVIIDNQMAAVKETVDSVSEAITRIRLDPVYDIIIKEE